MKKLVILLIVLSFFLASVAASFAQTSTLTATVRVNPLKVEFIAPPTSLIVGRWTDIDATVSNSGTQEVTKTIVTLNASPGIKIRGKRKKVGNLFAGQTENLSWRIKANRQGEFVIQVEATGKLAGEDISVSDSTIISATGSLGAFLLRLIFG